MLPILPFVLPLLLAQPPAVQVSKQGIVNAASGHPSGVAAVGSRITIRGVGFPASPQLTLQAGNQRWPVRVLQVSAARVEAVLPKEAPAGPAELSIAGIRVPFTIVDAAPVLFSTNGKGFGPARGDTPTAHAGGSIVVRATGLGKAVTVEASLGGVPAKVRALQRGPDGVDEITIAVPPNAPEGCFVPVQITVRDRISNTVAVSIGKAGKPCELPKHFPYAAWPGSRVGMVVLTRTQFHGLMGPGDRIWDEAVGAFVDLRDTHSPAGPLAYLPPLGSCAVYGEALGPETMVTTSFFGALVSELPGKGLAAGPRLTVADRHYLRSVNAVLGAPGVYRATLGVQEATPRRNLPLFLNTGTFRVSHYPPQGQTPFLLQLPAPASFRWTNHRDLAKVSRQRPLRVEWTGPDGDFMMAVLAISNNRERGEGGIVYCVASSKSGSFTIPTASLRALPPSDTSESAIVLVAFPHAVQTIPSPMLDHSIAFSVFTEASAVTFE
ncbi:MAG: hypothetical protein HY820_03895 [Acidobacteria bacterium]|nr:hypothetical protein [Acidobacteriota bacterium]